MHHSYSIVILPTWNLVLVVSQEYNDAPQVHNEKNLRPRRKSFILYSKGIIDSISLSSMSSRKLASVLRLASRKLTPLSCLVQGRDRDSGLRLAKKPVSFRLEWSCMYYTSGVNQSMSSHAWTFRMSRFHSQLPRVMSAASESFTWIVSCH